MLLMIIWGINGNLSVSRTVAAIAVMAIVAGLILFFDKAGEKTVCAITDTRIGRFTILDLIFILAIIALSVIARIKLIYIETIDYIVFYGRWVEQIRSIGWHALGCNIGDYSPLYTSIMVVLSVATALPKMLIVKLIPMIFDYVMGNVCVAIYKHCNPQADMWKKILVFALVVLNPLVMLNSAAWGQCDGIYTTFLLLTLLALMKTFKDEKYSSTVAFVFFAIAFAFKLQAIFFLPVMILCVFAGKRKTFSFSQFVYIPVVYLLTSIPMLAAGRSLKDTVMVYFAQTGEYTHKLSMRYGNFYSIIGNGENNLTEEFFFMGVAITVAFLGVLYYAVLRQKAEIAGKRLILVAALTIFIVAFFMPSMHERYAFAGEMMLIMYAMSDRKFVVPAAAALICTLLSYAEYLSNGYFIISQAGFVVTAVVRLAVIAALMYRCFNKEAADTAK